MYYELDYLQVKDIPHLVPVAVFIIFTSQGVFYNSYFTYITVEVLIELFIFESYQQSFCMYL